MRDGNAGNPATHSSDDAYGGQWLAEEFEDLLRRDSTQRHGPLEGLVPWNVRLPLKLHSMVKEYVAAQDGIVSEYPDLAGALDALSQLIERIPQQEKSQAA